MRTQPPSPEEDVKPAETSNVQRTPSNEKLVSQDGFALRDAAQHSFADFVLDESPFEYGGAYAISDPQGQVVYMGYSKNVAAKLEFHSRLQPQSCSSFRVYIPQVPPELISPDMLESVLEYWIREIGDVPRGNTVDRALWEQENPTDRKSKGIGKQPSSSTADDSDIPVRDRATEPRTSNRSDKPRYQSADPFADSFRSSSTQSDSSSRKGNPSSADGWNPSKEDFVEVEVDPFDPFSASNRNNTTRSSWSELEDDSHSDDWYPILMIMSAAGLIWLFGLLSNALPAATPSVGM